MINGVAVKLPAIAAQLLKNHPDVAYIEPNMVVTASDTQTDDLPWGLDHIDQALVAMAAKTFKKLVSTFTRM